MNQAILFMRFEQRELPPYAEPITADELKEGTVYFSVTYADEDELSSPGPFWGPAFALSIQ